MNIWGHRVGSWGIERFRVNVAIESQVDYQVISTLKFSHYAKIRVSHLKKNGELAVDET